MRLLKTSLLVIVALLSLNCVRVNERATFFRTPNLDTDSHVDSLRRQLEYMRSKLGFATYEYEFATPRDMKMIVTLKAEFKGQVVPDLSGIYVVPPTGQNQTQPGRVTINFFYPQYQAKSEGSPTWEFNITSGNTLYTWVAAAPFTPGEGRAVSTSPGGISPLNDDKEHDIWDYKIETIKAPQGGPPDFSYTLTVRLEKARSGEKLDKVIREEYK
jgi:hypothetical protein